MQRIFICLCLLFAFTPPCHAQAKPNTLTPKEIADGWILLFDGETTFGWTAIEGSRNAKEGTLLLANAKNMLMTTAAFFDFEFRFEYHCGSRNLPKLILSRGAENRDTILLPEGKGWQQAEFCITSAEFTGLARDSNDVVADVPQTKRSQLVGKTIIGFNGTFRNPGTPIQIRNIKLRPLNTASLFNGKDLAGWNVFPGRKSKFAVVDNAINVKDGPGDLQTVGKYKDFVLQLEAISNGKNLNSGIFFRCRDGEYQNGYEAQIHNGFAETPKKYLLEEYDAKTNKLIGKKEAMYTASDFGTGAIYRRVPARKQMSKDGEWFGMTVVANGNRFATWVNGIQVTDWTDNRPKSDNARTGCRLEGGHLSIQGHDPTTDLSFRNFRIAELK